MPKRNRHRKHGKSKAKANKKFGHILPDTSQVDLEGSVHDDDMSNTIVNLTTPCTTPSRVARSKKDSFEMETPVRPIPLQEGTNLNHKCDILTDPSLKSTPVNKRRSLNRQNEAKLNGTWNITNLNLLFDSNLDAPSSEVCLTPKSINESRRRSNSSIAMYSSGKEKPLSFNKSTQTEGENEAVSEGCDEITETPRVNQKILTDLDISRIQIPSQLNNSKHLYKQITLLNKCSEVNFNPYLKEKERISFEIDARRARWPKDGSIEEQSFFSPQLFDLKSSSTPIEGPKLLGLLMDGVTKENVDFINNHIQVDKTPRSGCLREQVLNNSFDQTIIDSGRRENVNLNTPPLTEKVLNKDKNNSVKLLGNGKRINRALSVSGLQSRISPKTSRLGNRSRQFTRNISYSRPSANRRLSLDQSNELGAPTMHMGIYEKIITKIKRYSKASAKWSVKMMEVCSQLGIHIKNSLTSLCNKYNEKSVLECSRTTCNCESFKSEIGNLNVKIGDLNEELGQLRHQIQERHTRQIRGEEDVEKLHEELNKVKASFKDMHSELTALKEQVQCSQNVPSTPFNRPPIAAIPPPPPPPPLPLLQAAPPKLMLGKKSRSVLGMGPKAEQGDSRPVISLDEILKVKLKKASDRPTVTPVLRHRTTSTSAISEDLLKQVKLRQPRPGLMRRMTLNGTSVSTPGGSSTPSSEQSTSPASSLNRLLDNNSVWRVKRLRKTGGYSFDSVHRRSPASVSPAAKRDKGGS